MKTQTIIFQMTNVFLYKPIKTGVIVAQSNQPKPILKLFKELVKQILYRYIKKKNYHITPKNPRFGE